MPHTAEEHFKMILGLTVADLAAQLATARATIEALDAQLAVLVAASPPPEQDQAP